MYKFSFLFVLLLVASGAFAQTERGDEYLKEPMDTTATVPVQLDEVFIGKQPNEADAETRKNFEILQRRIYRTYPYAKATAANLVSLNAGMAKLTSNKDKKKYFKIVEDYMQNQFEPQLKKLSRKDGQILVKLIYRQTGSTTFDLIKEYKSGWKAFWSNNTARLFDINLKTKYEPMAVNEDYLIETILNRAFAGGRLAKQDPAIPIDYDKARDYWAEKIAAAKKEN